MIVNYIPLTNEVRQCRYIHSTEKKLQNYLKYIFVFNPWPVWWIFYDVCREPTFYWNRYQLHRNSWNILKILDKSWKSYIPCMVASLASTKLTHFIPSSSFIELLVPDRSTRTAQDCAIPFYFVRNLSIALRNSIMQTCVRILHKMLKKYLRKYSWSANSIWTLLLLFVKAAWFHSSLLWLFPPKIF